MKKTESETIQTFASCKYQLQILIDSPSVDDTKNGLYTFYNVGHGNWVLGMMNNSFKGALM